MKTQNQKQSKMGKALKTVLFLGAVIGIVIVTLNDDSASSKYQIGSAKVDAKSGYEVSYINLTGKKTIEEKKIKLSENYWSSGRFNF